MIPGSLGEGQMELNIKGRLLKIREFCRRYFWLWIAYQTVKGLTTTTLIWAPLAWLWFER